LDFGRLRREYSNGFLFRLNGLEAGGDGEVWELNGVSRGELGVDELAAAAVHIAIVNAQSRLADRPLSCFYLEAVGVDDGLAQVFRAVVFDDE
jgi:hypothetical protein